LSDIIKLLTDAVANQIAAGEVVQRPANAVKELLENSIDAGATQIKLLIKDGGSTLMQVIDNGKGMSETDARMCWERHATSKIRKAEDLFSLHTYGFRGEALASIAAVAQVEMITKRKEDEVATFIRIEASEVIEQRMETATDGTSIAIKNLFYNIPARRNFLKSISVETKHIFEEFQRQAMANPHIHFIIYNSNSEVYNWVPKSHLDRLADALTKKNTAEFLPLEEITEIVEITGFAGTPNISKKTRGDQYFFMNDRFIKSAYFHHAVMAAYEGLIESDSFPTYTLFLKVAPNKVDVNVHPTKTEVKFEDEKHIYNLIKAAVRKSLGTFVVQPNSEILGMENINQWLSQPNNTNQTQNWNRIEQPYTEKIDSRYNPFTQDRKPYDRNSNQDWQKILGSVEPHFNQQTIQSSVGNLHQQDAFSATENDIAILGWFNLAERYVVANVEGNLYIIDKRLGHQHILFQQYFKQLEQLKGTTQQLLFPRNVELSPSHLAVALEIIDDLKHLGFDLGHFGGNSILVNGLPAQIASCDEQKLLEHIIEDYLNTQGDLKLTKHQSLALSMSRQGVNYSQNFTSSDEVKFLIKEIFALSNPQFTFDGKLVFVKLTAETIFDLFKKQRVL
jgi:DNA mismatch repair protein MutL